MTNLRSVDLNKAKTSCACQSVNYQDEAMGSTGSWDTYQYETTLASAVLFLTDASRAAHVRECYRDVLGPTASASYSVLIGT